MKETKKIHIGVMGGKGSGKKTFLKMQDPSNKSLD
jgi:uridine kinase